MTADPKSTERKNSLDSTTKIDAERAVESLAELHNLTRLPRIGWVMAGVPDPETVSDHCFETALIAYILSKYVDQPVDLGRILSMALFHEVGEVRLTDLPRRSGPYVKKFKHDAERLIGYDVLAGVVAEEVTELLDEMAAGVTLEARIAESAEELQIIMAAMHYAKENRGDISEYRRDAEKYDSLGVDPAEAVSQVVKKRLLEYLGDKPYWEIGYRRS